MTVYWQHGNVSLGTPVNYGGAMSSGGRGQHGQDVNTCPHCSVVWPSSLWKNSHFLSFSEAISLLAPFS